MPPSITLPFGSPVRAELIYMYDGRVLPEGLVSTLVHPPLTVWVVRDGRVDVSFSGRFPAVRGEEGEALFLPSTPRTHRIREGTKLLSARFELRSASGPVYGSGVHPFVATEEVTSLVEAGEALERRSRALFGTCARNNTYPRDRVDLSSSESLASLLSWSGAFTAWMREVVDRMARAGWRRETHEDLHPVVSRSLDLMKEEGWAGRYKGEDLADAAGMSLTHFKRLFRRETGLPFKQWMDRERLRGVTRRLETEDVPLKTLAHEFGFSTPSHFSAWFKSQTGVTPLSYRGSVAGVGI